MTAVSPLVFGAIFWGTIGLVLVILLYELVAVATDLGWVPGWRRADD